MRANVEDPADQALAQPDDQVALGESARLSLLAAGSMSRATMPVMSTVSTHITEEMRQVCAASSRTSGRPHWRNAGRSANARPGRC